MLLLFRSEENLEISPRSNRRFGRTHAIWGSRRREDSTSFAGSRRGRAASAELALVSTSLKLESEMIRVTTYTSEETTKGGGRGGGRGGRSHTFAVRIRGRWSTQLSEVGTENTNGRNGSLIPRPAPCQCLSSISFISFILLFFVIVPPRPFPSPPCPPPRFCGVHALFLVAG